MSQPCSAPSKAVLSLFRASLIHAPITYLHVSCLLRMFVTKLRVYLEFENVIIGNAKDRCVQAAPYYMYVDTCTYCKIFTCLHDGRLFSL